jgi:hypothetical protein
MGAGEATPSSHNYAVVKDVWIFLAKNNSFLIPWQHCFVPEKTLCALLWRKCSFFLKLCIPCLITTWLTHWLELFFRSSWLNDIIHTADYIVSVWSYWDCVMIKTWSKTVISFRTWEVKPWLRDVPHWLLFFFFCFYMWGLYHILKSWKSHIIVIFPLRTLQSNYLVISTNYFTYKWAYSSM